MSRFSVKYSKQDGHLLLSSGGDRAVLFQPQQGGSSVTIPLPDIINLQQTPPTASKASIRITAKENHTFTFTSSDARADQETVTNILRQWIEPLKADKAKKTTTPAPEPDNGRTQSAAMAMAQATSRPATSAPQSDEAYDDSRLLRDVDLQRSLLSSSPALRQRFDQALRDKPDTITVAQLATQFWATRLHLLRSHVAEKAQGLGNYNVLAVIKPQHVDGKIKLDMTKEQIQLLFAQHPLIKRVYNENVPQIKEDDFWSRFFFSRLVKKMRGEKIIESDNVDPTFDKYLDMNDDDGAQATQLATDGIPRFLDLEGNEQNHSQRRGNGPDVQMRPSSNAKEPILRTLNRMSEKLMAEVPPSDTDRHAPVGVDERTYRELQLRDLQRSEEDNRVVLKIKDQAQLFAAGQGVQASSRASTYAKRTPAQVLSILQKDFGQLTAHQRDVTGLSLESAIGVDEDSSSDEESAVRKSTKLGSKASRTAATTQIFKAINTQHLHDDEADLQHLTASSDQAAKLGLSKTQFDALAMTHNTTVEFLHYFWSVFLSGDPERSSEAVRLIETLDKSLDRIKAVADSAEAERAARVEQMTRDNEAYTKRTGKRRKFDPKRIQGGEDTVNKLVSPLLRAIRQAKEKFEKGLHDQVAHAMIPNSKPLVEA
ncbi:RNA polymerase II transcription factor-like protein [Sporormia fimetaria CBS 119925]|uniref:RNA polymerase II transcription factor-like protein n=1 Tax=Sporormia fimetaria CBS 119925 TaxID=1340428 RepID=A0A6A6UV62_9PLEO|nr:RNA polymerase II transcription factor-like protein [Sporormia fimetaria CBS 119925]